MSKTLRKIFVLTVIFSFFNFTLNAQQIQEDLLEEDIFIPEPTKPPMQNVFFNVIWGSLAGGVLYVGAAALFDETESNDSSNNGDNNNDNNDNNNNSFSASTIRNRFGTGATVGAFVALGVSVFLSYKNITFEKPETGANQNVRRFNPLEVEDSILRDGQIQNKPDQKSFVEIPFFQSSF